MKIPTEWSAVIDGKGYKFTHQIIKNKHVITINGDTIEVKGSLLSKTLNFDEKITFDGREARFFVDKQTPDIVVDGVCIRSGKKYIARPAWSIVFAVICLLIPVVSLGGAIPFLIGFAGAAICISAARTTLPTAVRVGLCVIITALVWGLFVFLLYLAQGGF